MSGKPFLFLFFLAYVLPLGAQVLVINNAEDDFFNLQPYASFADADNHAYTLAEVRNPQPGFVFSPLLPEKQNIGFTAHHFWVTFSLKNNTNSSLSYYLQTARPITNFADLYLISSEGDVLVQHSGDAIPFAQRAHPSRKTIFKITLSPGQYYTGYLHLKSDGEVLDLPLELYTPERFYKATSPELLFFGFFYGILLLAVLIYLFFYVSLFDKSFINYSLYVVFVGLLQFSLDGFFYKYIMPGSGWLYLRVIVLFAALTAYFLGKYSLSFLGLSQHFKILPKAFKVVNILLALLFVGVLFSDAVFEISYPLVNFLGLVVLVMVVLAVVVMDIRKIKVDMFFSLGIFFLVLGFIIFILKNFNVLPSSFITENSTKLGTWMEVVFLSLSMLNRIKKLRGEKETMQALALQRAEEANELKSYFMSNMSHELRTPLNSIMGISDVMAKEVTDEKIRNNFEIIKYSSYSLLSIVNDILDFSKIQKGELTLDPVIFSPQKILEQLKNNWAAQAQEKGLVFNYTYDESIPPQLYGDALRLGQIVNNILNNAVKFTQKGEILFEVTHTKKNKEKLLLTLCITDTGMGIPKEKLETIFTSFVQEKNDNKRTFGGVGLGLSIVKELVNRHGGTIKIESDVKKGSCVTITLPYKISEEKNASARYPDTEFDLLGAHVLVAEDNAMNQFIIKTILSRWKNTAITIVDNGKECLNALAKEAFDIVLMDLQMPVMDGYEATENIRAGKAGSNNKNIPIVAVTADITESAKLKAQLLGMNDYLTKPIDQSILYQVVTRQLSLSKS